VGKVELNLSDRIATKGFSRSGLVVERIVLAENYEIKGLRYRHSTPGKGQAAVALLTTAAAISAEEVLYCERS
jgi:hypothetical protein